MKFTATSRQPVWLARPTTSSSFSLRIQRLASFQGPSYRSFLRDFGIAESRCCRGKPSPAFYCNSFSDSGESHSAASLFRGYCKAEYPTRSFPAKSRISAGPGPRFSSKAARQRTLPASVVHSGSTQNYVSALHAIFGAVVESKNGEIEKSLLPD